MVDVGNELAEEIIEAVVVSQEDVVADDMVFTTDPAKVFDTIVVVGSTLLVTMLVPVVQVDVEVTGTMGVSARLDDVMDGIKEPTGPIGPIGATEDEDCMHVSMVLKLVMVLKIC